MKVTFQSEAWLTDYSRTTPEQLQTPEGARDCIFSTADMTAQGWTRVGTAEITVDMVEPRQLIDNKVAALREQVVAIRAEATAKCTQLEGLIQQLLCIENAT